jgi:WD40 repeat protein
VCCLRILSCHILIEIRRVFALSVLELTSSSRSILYSAHVFWESEDCVLVAAGTAFGEIMYWSWSRNSDIESKSRVHRVFLGHEGSIFGVRISKELPSGCCQTLKRIIASCSDDRTIRIWDVSDVAVRESHATTSVQVKDSERTQHTGFSNAAFDPNAFSSSQCLAIGWGHASRVWTVQFLESTPCEGALLLVSTGEDATSRTWKLSLDKTEGATLPYQLLQQDSAAHHSGKNIWSSAIYGEPARRQHIVCGAADSKITSYPLVRVSEKARECRVQEYTVPDILSLAQMPRQQLESTVVEQSHKSSKKAEFFRSYCFLDQESFLLTTNSGSVLVGSLRSHTHPDGSRGLSQTTFIDQLSDLSGYSICVGDTASRVAFVAGSTGSIYMFKKSSNTLSKFGSFDAKIGEMFATNVRRADGSDLTALLITLVGKREAQLLMVDVAADPDSCITQTIIVPQLELPVGSMITSMALTTTPTANFIHLGLRRGSIVIYSVPSTVSEDNNCASLFATINKAHGEETVTALIWVASVQDPFVGYLTTVGRDGCIAIHRLDLHSNAVELVHNLALPIGSNIEGLYFQQGHLLVHGFSSKKWVLYDVSLEDEIMGVETGGAHRSWAFQPDQGYQGGGTLVWTRASSMHIRSQGGPDHSVVRSGGHGREIKAVAISQGQYGQLIATGAEDTDIKIFEYVAGELHCRRTLRRHTTGIQHLQWSEDGKYLFSSGGCEEFYVWRIRQLPSDMGIGIVCEITYTPESEHADLRIMSFDVQSRGIEFDIAMVFSDSSIKVTSLYNPFSNRLTKEFRCIDFLLSVVP